MKYEAFVLSDKIKVHEVKFYLYPELWEQFQHGTFDITNGNWKEVKFLNDTGDDVSDDVKALPGDHGGIYIFIIKNPIIAKITEYLGYIGRAQLTENHNLKVRCRKYFYEWFGENGRPKVTRMIGKWGQYLYLRYIEIDDNNETRQLETKLINSILPPFNDEIPDVIYRQAVSALN